MSDNSWFKKTYSKEWCQGFCTLCGTSCADYCEKTHELQNQVKELEAHNAQLRDALDFIGHECMHSHDNCPTREHMQIKAREVLQSTPSHAHEEWKAMKEQLAIQDKIIEERNKLLVELECETHGQCVPGAIEQVRAMKAVCEAARAVVPLLGHKYRCSKKEDCYAGCHELEPLATSLSALEKVREGNKDE